MATMNNGRACVYNVLLLFQASVFSPSPRKHYLNITLSNVVHVFPANKSSVPHSLNQSVDLVNESNPEQRVLEEDVSTVSALLNGLGDDVFNDDM